MMMDKGILNESHPQFVGMYSGAASSPEVLRAVEGADLVIDAGGVCFHDINTAAYSQKIAPEKMVTIGIDHVRVGDRIFNPVRMGDLFDGLAAAVTRTSAIPRRERRHRKNEAAMRTTRLPPRRSTPAMRSFCGPATAS